MNIITILLILTGVVAVYLIATYNSFQTIRTRITASIQEIGNQLKRQVDLIPNLEASVKGYLKHEKTIFDKLTEARKLVAEAVKSGTMAGLDKASAAMQQLLPNLKIIVEDNPEIKADQTVVKLMDELRDTADKVMYARRTLIDLVADFNRLLITFPSNLVGKVFGMKTETGLETPFEGEHLAVTAGETKTPGVNLE